MFVSAVRLKGVYSSGALRGRRDVADFVLSNTVADTQSHETFRRLLPLAGALQMGKPTSVGEVIRLANIEHVPSPVLRRGDHIGDANRPMAGTS
jgi:hypothetical protein